MKEERAQIDIKDVVANNANIITTATEHITQCCELLANAYIPYANIVNYKPFEPFYKKDAPNTLKVFLSLDTKGLSKSEALEAKMKLLESYKKDDTNIIIINDYSHVDEPTKGDTLAWSLLAMKEADLLIFDTSDPSPVCEIQHIFFYEYLRSSYDLEQSFKTIVARRK